MTYWFSRTHRLRPVSEIIAGYRPLPYGRWERITPTREIEVLEVYKEQMPSVYERLREKDTPLEELYAKKRKKIAEVELLPEQTIMVETPVWSQMKGYIVWYSGSKRGRDYKVKREINVYYWLSSQEIITEDQVKGWLNQAVKHIFGGLNLGTIEGWIEAIQSEGRCPHTCYMTEMANTGRVETKEPSDHNEISWEYLVDGRKEKGSPPYFWKW